MRPNLKYVAFFLCATFLMTGCGTATELFVDSTKSVLFAKNKKLTHAIVDNSAVESKIIKVNVSRVSFLINKVHSEPASLAIEDASGLIGIWTTPAGETLRITDQGRLVGSSGTLFADWANVRTTKTPEWLAIREALEGNRVVTYFRTRDLESGGYAGIQEKVTILKYKDYSELNVSGSSQSNIYWFLEKSEIIDPVNRIKKIKKFLEPGLEHLEALPDAVFAVSFENDKNGKVIYSKQCLSKLMCFEFRYQ